MVPVPGPPPMDEKQVKRAELVESPTTRLAFKVSERGWTFVRSISSIGRWLASRFLTLLCPPHAFLCVFSWVHSVLRTSALLATRIAVRI